MNPLFYFLCGGLSVAAINVVAFAYWRHRERRLPPVAPQPPAVQHFVRTWKPLTPEQWAIAFREWPETDPRWRAVWDLLCHHLEAELACAEGIGSDPHALAQWSGRLQTLLFIRAQILNLRQK